MATRAPQRTENATDEQWETTTPGVTWIKVTNRAGDIRLVRVGGRVGHRFRMSVDDRVMNQDEVADPQHDPFTNGLLFRIKGEIPVSPPIQDHSIESLDAPPPAADQMLSVDDLRGIMGKHGNAFRAQIARLNEVNLRRLVDIAEEMQESLTVAQQAAIDELLRAYRPGGQQPSYATFMRGPTDGVTAAGTPT